MTFLLILGAGCRATSQPTPMPEFSEIIMTQTREPEQIPTATPEITTQPDDLAATPETEKEPTPTPTLEHIEFASETWTKTYGRNHENMASDLVLAPDGGFLLVGGIGKVYEDDQEGGVLLIRVDPTGDILWHRVYGGENFDIGWSITPTPDGHYLISGETTSFGAGGMDIYLIKVDQDGHEIWSKTYGSPMDEVVSSVRSTLDGGFILFGNQVDPNDIITDPGMAGYAGFAGRSDIHVVKIDAEGNVIWSKTYKSAENTIASSGVVVRDGSYLVLASIIHFPSLDNDLLLLKIDDNGDEVWSRTLEEDSYAGYGLIETFDRNHLITGIYQSAEDTLSDAYALKLDGEGQVIWRYPYGDPGFNEVGSGILEVHDNNIMILSSMTRSDFSGESSIKLFAIDSDGILLWDKIIAIFQFAKVSAFIQHPDGGFMITGSTLRSGGTHNAFLIKTDAYGNVSGSVESIPFP